MGTERGDSRVIVINAIDRWLVGNTGLEEFNLLEHDGR